MTSDAVTPAPTFPPRRLLMLAAIAVGAAALVAGLRYGVGHAPDGAMLARQPRVIHLHVAAALLALVLGTAQLVGVKGTTAHRALGWTWVVAMATVAISSLFIRQINPGGFSLIHLLSGWTLIALPMAVWAIRRGKVRAHARAMTTLFVGGLIVAGAFTFMPGRLLWQVFFG